MIDFFYRGHRGKIGNNKKACEIEMELLKKLGFFDPSIYKGMTVVYFCNEILAEFEFNGFSSSDIYKMVENAQSDIESDDTTYVYLVMVGKDEITFFCITKEDTESNLYKKLLKENKYFVYNKNLKNSDFSGYEEIKITKKHKDEERWKYHG